MWTRTWMVLGLSGVLLAGSGARAADEKVVVTRGRDIKIPLHLDPAARVRIGAGEITLFVSTDEGGTWRVASRVSPEQRAFAFSAPTDGDYGFAVSLTPRGQEADTKPSPGLKVKVEAGDRGGHEGEGSQTRGSLDEARLNVELLTLELDAEKNQLRQQLQMLKQYEFGFGGMGGMGGFGGGAPDPEGMKAEQQKAVASLRERYEGVKAAVLETSRKLGQERRRLAELERRGEAGDDRGEAESERRGRDDFFRTGNYIINMKRIDYVQRLENGLVRIYFSNKESTILSTEASKEFFQRFAPETR